MSLGPWDRQAQERLKSSRVFLTSAAGAAGVAAHQLLAAGLGALRLVDASRIILGDLSQQTLFRERDLGKAKAAVAEALLSEVNPFSRVECLAKSLSEANVWRLTAGCHLLAATDARSAQLLHLPAVRHRLPLVCAFTGSTEVRVTTLWPGQGPCLACVAPDRLGPTSLSAAPPALAPVAALAGGLMALEALRLLGGAGPALLGRLLIFRVRDCHFSQESLPRRSLCPLCRNIPPPG
jgi:molybdopterin/thiamine biosynthesis adenylyltransferase